MQPQALMEQDSISFSKLQAEVQAQGHQGGNIIREFDEGMSLTLQRPLQDLSGKLPKISVRSLPSPDLESLGCKLCRSRALLKWSALHASAWVVSHGKSRQVQKGHQPCGAPIILGTQLAG